MSRHLNLITGLTVLQFSLAVSNASAIEMVPPSVITLQIENDFFARQAGTDRHYTNGLRLAAVWPRSTAILPLLDSVLNVDPIVPITAVTPRRTFSISVGQSIFTPEDTAAPSLVLSDRPYAGWLYLGIALQKAFERLGEWSVHDSFALELGIVGPHAFGRDVQNNFHRLIGQDKAHGWDHQLRDETGANLNLERLYRSPPYPVIHGVSVDTISGAALSLGNVSTQFALGGIARIGRGLDVDFGPPRIRPSLPGSDSAERGSPAWYFFLGVDGRVVARDITLDGNTLEQSHSVQKRHAVADLKTGFAIFWGATRITFSHVLRTSEFIGQQAHDQFGSLSISFSF